MQVIQFIQPKKYDPHLTGNARCSTCKHEWIAVAPIGEDWLECPGCNEVKGRFVHDAVPNDDVWVCKCGCDVFRVTRNAAFCIHCGNRQSF